MPKYTLTVQTDDSDGELTPAELAEEVEKLEDAITDSGVWEFVEYPKLVEE